MKLIKRILSFVLISKNRTRNYVRLLIALKKKKKFKIIRLILQEHLRNKCHILIGERPIIGSLNMPHPHNICIGAYTTIGENCTLYHDVTIGQSMGLFPQLGNNVIVYTGAKIIGGVTIGDNAVIGANAVVTSDVPSNAIVAGIPAKVIRYRCEDDKLY